MVRNKYARIDYPYLHYPFISMEIPDSTISTDSLYLPLFDALPGNSVLLKADAPTYTVLAVTAQYLKDTGIKKEDIIGRGIFEAFPANDADPNHTGESDLQASYRYEIRKMTK